MLNIDKVELDTVSKGEAIVSQARQLMNERNIGSQTIIGFIPLNDLVVLKEDVIEETTSFGLVLPDTARASLQDGLRSGVVVACGPGKVDHRTGGLVPTCVRVGDRVKLPDFNFDKIYLNGEEYTWIRESDILGFLI